MKHTHPFEVHGSKIRRYHSGTFTPQYHHGTGHLPVLSNAKATALVALRVSGSATQVTGQVTEVKWVGQGGLSPNFEAKKAK